MSSPTERKQMYPKKSKWFFSPSKSETSEYADAAILEHHCDKIMHILEKIKSILLAIITLEDVVAGHWDINNFIQDINSFIQDRLSTASFQAK